MIYWCNLFSHFVFTVLGKNNTEKCNYITTSINYLTKMFQICIISIKKKVYFKQKQES